ncbi:MAG TPA: hypothetical protein VJ865_03995, partial [Gemmatimonadaceae bacterium]|nr:hypothetical protein [Gemmatimonadaceae bacterium]
MFSGVTMTVTRVGASGVSRLGDVEIAADLGVNHNRNFGHVAGASRTSFEGRVKLAIEPRWSVNF